MSNIIDLNLTHHFAAKDFLIAFSGGLDSTVLLHLIHSSLKKRREISPPTIRAIHIHHGLSPNADAWATHCAKFCAQLGVELIVEYVEIKHKQNLEAEAINARYHAIKRHISPNEVLLTAHHLNDQSETFFLALKRGSGLAGLSAMARENVLFEIPILRPLLNYSRETLANYAETHSLSWIEDESNTNLDFDRNFLRHQILPLLRQRWAHFDQSVQRSAQHCATQQQLIDELLNETYQNHLELEDHQLMFNNSSFIDNIGIKNAGKFRRPINESAFQLLRFSTYSPLKQAALLRRWLAENQCEMPSQIQLTQLIQDVVNAKADAIPQFQLGKKMIRRFRGKLFLTPIFSDLRKTAIPLKLNEKISLPDNLGECFAEQNEQGIVFHWQHLSLQLEHTTEPIQIRFGFSGKIRTAPQQLRETMKKTWQHCGVPPWQRHRIPLIFYGDQLKGAIGFFKIY